MTDPEKSLTDEDIRTEVLGTGTIASLEDPGTRDADDTDDTDADDDAVDDADDTDTTDS